MHRERDCILGIDTSNYKTSAAVINKEGFILKDLRILLKVKQGERGLRQSDALFQHMENLPKLLEDALSKEMGRRVAAVAFSDKPRPVEGSYMPVFKAGIGFGQTVAAALQVPYYSFSHQEGHIEAIKAYSNFNDQEGFLCYHLSGGTCELLKVIHGKISIVGGSKDISFGQVIDRIGVAMGMAFPAGEEMDCQAMAAENSTQILTRIKTDGLFFNLSGIETQCTRQVESNGENSDLIREVFDRMAEVLIQVSKKACKETGIHRVLFTGGVASSQYISRRLNDYFKDTSVHIEFGQQQLSQDNAVGIALLGGKRLWQSSR